MDRLPSLSSERLLVRVPTPSDAERIAMFQSENRAHLAPWEPLRPEEYFLASYWREELERLVPQVLSEHRILFILLPRGAPDGPVLGQCSVTNIVRGPFQAAHIGFAVARTAQGCGFMFEALTQVIHFAFDDLRLHRLMANYQPENLRSAALLHRLGFTIEGIARDYLFLNGAWREHVLTSLINPAWRGA